MQRNHYRRTFNYILKNIIIISTKKLLRPESLTIKLKDIDWKLDNNKNLYKELQESKPDLLRYFGICDDDTLRIKVKDQLKHLDW